MAPSRRRGASKAAAAAAACRQWKVGDLVLAKVKGFPAWPATVSEPTKWGYSTDWKKVLVYFFGTQQIAFCNPADVEAFTEEKKQSLLGKRHGKGADFVRAVQEIVDSYEKLKKDTQLAETRPGGDAANADVSNPVNSSAKDQADAPELTHKLLMNSSTSDLKKQEVVYADDNDSATVFKGELMEEPTNKTAPVKSPKTLTYTSRKRSVDDLCRQGCVTNRHTPVRRSRNLLWIQNYVLPGSDSGKSAGDPSTNEAQSEPLKRNGSLGNSPDSSGCNNFNSSDFVPNGSMEDNSSEIITIDSDSLNEGSAIDSNFRLEHSETLECPEVELNQGLDLDIKAVVNKKKRKPNRKRAANDVSKSACGPGKENGVQNATKSSQNICGNPNVRCFEQDGDEHLPLVKRARVRMGKSSFMEAELHSTLHAQEKNCKEDTNSAQQMITSSNCENGSPADGDSSVLNGALDNVSPSKVSVPGSNTQIYNIKKDQTYCSVDGEAALPPSKRLHRALEAMSANAAEQGQAYVEVSSSIMTSSGTCYISAIKRSMCTATINNPEENESSIQVDKQLNMLQLNETGKDVLADATDQVGEELGDHVVCQTDTADFKIQLHEQISPNHDSKCGEVGSNEDSPDPSLPPNDDDNIRTANHLNTASDESEHNGISFDPVMAVNRSNDFLPQNNMDLPPDEIAICEDMKCMKPAVGDISKTIDMIEVVEKVKCKGPEEDMNSVSTSIDCLGGKSIFGIRSSSSLTDGGDCIPQGSPPTTSVCNVSTSDSSNILHNESCSPDVHLHQKQTLSGPVDGSKNGYLTTQQSRSMGKSSEAARAALLYFEAMLGTLTRTKESIGQATRIAIDCAKFGIASKVMEILAHSLEVESSLHRRVDLFFLVDSIAQFSRGLKGDVCGVYSSAIQAVLPRLLSAAAPPGNTAQENRRQCLKVLRLWMERRILPESIIRQHIREVDLYSSSAAAGVYSRRSLRTERALDDPVREMEGMLVDEYGSNSSLQMPGFCMPRMLKDEDEGEGSDSDGGNFEAVTPEHTSEAHETTAIVKHRRILEDVDGELEMEDVAPCCADGMYSICNVDRGNALQFEKNMPLSFAPSHQDVPSSSLPPLSFHPPPPPPPPSPSPPPPPPPPPPLLHQVSSNYGPCHTKGYTVSQTSKDNPLHSVALPVTAPRHSQPISDVTHYEVPEYREMQMSLPESTCSFNKFSVPPADNFQHSDSATMHNKGYSIRPPHHVPSNQFSFVHGEQHVKHQREAPPPPYSSRQQFVQNLERENIFNNHERLKPPPYDYRERWNVPAPPYDYPGPRYQDKGVPAPYGCHPCEPARIPGHGWRFPPRSMNQRNSMPLRPPFEDAIPVANKGQSFWRPR